MIRVQRQVQYRFVLCCGSFSVQGAKHIIVSLWSLLPCYFVSWARVVGGSKSDFGGLHDRACRERHLS